MRKGTGSAQTCGVPGCHHVRHAKNRCHKHYQRLVFRRARVPHAVRCECLDCLELRREERRSAQQQTIDMYGPALLEATK